LLEAQSRGIKLSEQSQRLITDIIPKDNRLIQAASQILELGSCAVSKPIRAGFTTSCIFACEQKGLKLLVVAPTSRILKETVSNASIDPIRIPANNECPALKEEIKVYPILKQLPAFLPDCTKCRAKTWCEVRQILREDEFKTAGLTYAKLEALMLADSKTSREILTKIRRAGVVLLDEAHTISLPSPVSVPVLASINIPNQPKYKALRDVYQRFIDLCQDNLETIQGLKEQAARGHTGQHLSQSVFIGAPLKWKLLRSAWKQLKEAAIKGDIPENELLLLRDIIAILGGTQCNIGYISEEEGNKGIVYLSAGIHRSWRALHEFLTNYAPNAAHLYVSGTLIEQKEGYFSELSGKAIKQAIYPDVRGATKKVTLIPDRWKLNSRNFSQKLPVILETIQAIAAREQQPIYLLAPNSRKAGLIRAELKDLEIRNSKIKVDYYRSDQTLGVERKERICIALGFAEIPANTFDFLAWGMDQEERWLESRKLRLQAVHAATWQAVNRCRDPEGLQESRIYFIGCRLDQVQQVARWGINRQLCLREIRESQFQLDQTTIKTPIFDITIDQELELPKVFIENKHNTHSKRRQVSDLIKEIVPYNYEFIKSENQANFSTYINRENGLKVTFYNLPKINYEIDSTVQLLYSTFVNRTDCHAKQFKNSSSGKWEFYKVNGPIDEPKLKQHIQGNITLGTYQISLDDTCKWVCDDIDSHNDEGDSREKVSRVVDVLRAYKVPFLLEASGSVDSYHIWILLSETKTYNAYRFIRQINAEAKVSCECWPKQKSIDSHQARYGNLLKIPICYHHKSGGRSAFLDADTFEPLEGPIELLGLVHLLEISEYSDTSAMSTGMPKVSHRISNTSKLKQAACSTELNYCMQRALEDKLQLNGSEGHYLRLAIAVKAQSIGLDAEATAQLFQFQNDYDHDFSLNKVLEVWSYGYNPFSCATLQDKCKTLIQGYCLSCPFGLFYRHISEVLAWP
jgi:hypothetical protein